jgi:predicted small lipoprotein YifL
MRSWAIAAIVALTLAACGDDGPAKFAELYDTAPPAAVPASTDPVPASGPIPYGTYWAVATSPELGFRITQATFGDSVTEIAEPARDLTSPPSAILTATVVDEATQVNYAVTGDELARLIAGEPANTPEGVTFAYTPFPFLLTVRDGQVTTALQIWMP